jgi:hypothetical protein
MRFPQLYWNSKGDQEQFRAQILLSQDHLAAEASEVLVQQQPNQRGVNPKSAPQEFLDV